MEGPSAKDIGAGNVFGRMDAVLLDVRPSPEYYNGWFKHLCLRSKPPSQYSGARKSKHLCLYLRLPP